MAIPQNLLWFLNGFIFLFVCVFHNNDLQVLFDLTLLKVLHHWPVTRQMPSKLTIMIQTLLEVYAHRWGGAYIAFLRDDQLSRKFLRWPLCSVVGEVRTVTFASLPKSGVEVWGFRGCWCPFHRPKPPEKEPEVAATAWPDALWALALIARVRTPLESVFWMLLFLKFSFTC